MSKIALGDVITATITDENASYFFAQKDGITYEIAKDELLKAPKFGAKITGFAYENDQHRYQITKTIPAVQKDSYAWGTVVASRHDLGVFVAIGLPNKDVVISLDELPTITTLWPKKGDRLLLSLTQDTKNRLWGKLARPEIFQAVARRVPQGKQPKKVTATVYRNKLVGTLVITDDYYLGFIHESQRIDEPRLGERLEARVLSVSDEGQFQLSLKPLAHKVMAEDAAFLLAQLRRRPDKTLPVTDRSAPELIKRQFGFSKSQFKRAVGRLLKMGYITQDADGLHLTASAPAAE